MMGAALMTKSVLPPMSVDLGYDPHNVATLTTNVRGYKPAANRPGYYQQVLAGFVQPGESAGFVSTIPMDQIILFAADYSPSRNRRAVPENNESCARSQFPMEDLIAKHIISDEIAGVIGDVRMDSLDNAPTMQARTH